MVYQLTTPDFVIFMCTLYFMADYAGNQRNPQKPAEMATVGGSSRPANQPCGTLVPSSLAPPGVRVFRWLFGDENHGRDAPDAGDLHPGDRPDFLADPLDYRVCTDP